MDPNKHHNALDLNAKLHWYEIKSILGQGGFGITYLAYDTNLKQQVAIKEYMPVEFSTRDASNTVQPISQNHSKIYSWGLKRFLEEAQTLARFKHPNIIRVHSFFEENNTGYIIMDYENGVELASLIRQGEHFNEQRLLDVLLPIVDGLEEVHKSGIIHRDIKPANIFIRNDGSPVLLDFGSARHAISGQTKTMTSLVTPGFAPFEQYHEAEGKQGPWTDIYALGATAHCMLTGKPPPEALKRGMMQFEHNTDIYLELADIKAGKYSDALLEAIDCALRFREKDRPQTVGAWKQMITAGKPVPSPQARQVEDDIDIPTTQNLSAKAVSKPAEDRAKKSLWPLARTAVILLLLGGGGFYLYDNQQSIKQSIDAYIEGITARKLAEEEAAREAREKELARQQELKKQLEEEARLQAIEAEKIAQQKREQRKKELLDELNQLEQQSGATRSKLLTEQEKLAAEQALQAEKEKLELEKQRLAEIARQEELLRQEAEQKLKQEQAQLEAEKKRLDELKQKAEQESKRQAELKQQAELAEQEAERKREAELSKQQTELARLEAEKNKRTQELEQQRRLQEELARNLAEQKDLQGLTFEAAVAQILQAVNQSSTGAGAVDKNIIEEIVRLRMEKLRAEEAARIKAENTEKAKQHLKVADKQLEFRNFEIALADYRQAYNLNPNSLVRFLAAEGMIKSMHELYSFGQVNKLETFTGDSGENLSGEYWGQLKWTLPSRADTRYVAILAGHFDNQLILVPVDLDILIITGLDGNTQSFEFYDIKRNIVGSGELASKPSTQSLQFNWVSDDGKSTGSWSGGDHSTVWIIDITGEYLVTVHDAPRNLFRKKTFKLNIKDESPKLDAYNPEEITAISEDDQIIMQGEKILVRRVAMTFLSRVRGMEGTSEWYIHEDGARIDGTWKVDRTGDKGKWEMTKIE